MNQCKLIVFLIHVIFFQIANAQEAYVNSSSGFITVYDLESSQIIHQIKLGGYQIGMALSTDKSTLYTVGNDTVYVLSTLSNTIQDKIGIINSPARLTMMPDGSKLYVTHAVDNKISVIDPLTNSIISTINVGDGPWDMSIDAERNIGYVACHRDEMVAVIDLEVDQVIDQIKVGNFPTGVVYNPINSKVYVSNYRDDQISIINAITNEVISTKNVGIQPWSMGISDDGAKLYVPCRGSDSLWVINSEDDSIESVIKTGTGPTSVTILSDSIIYVVNIFSNDVSIINVNSNSFVENKVIGPSPSRIIFKKEVISSTSNLKLGKESINVFPNPTSNYLNIKSDLPIFAVDIFNSIGRKMKTEKFLYQDQMKIDLSTLPKDYYYLKIFTTKGDVVSKILKR